MKWKPESSQFRSATGVFVPTFTSMFLASSNDPPPLACCSALISCPKSFWILISLSLLYKPHVIFERGKSVKKLNLIGRDLNKIIFVDNMKCNAKYNPKNLYLIPSWTDDIYDDELFKLKEKLKYIYCSGKFNDDITKALWIYLYLFTNITFLN